MKNKIKVNKDTISQLHNESKELDHQLQNTILSQKVVSKKIQNNNQQIEQLREEIQHEKNKKEELTLEMVDLEAGNFNYFVNLPCLKSLIKSDRFS